MKQKFLLAVCCFICVFSCGSTSSAIADEPLVAGSKEYIVFLDLTRLVNTSAADHDAVVSLWETMHFTATLQGIVNRDRPRLYIDYVNTEGTDVDRFWWEKCVGDGKWLQGKEVLRMTDPVKALEYFKDEIRGMVVYDPAVASTSNVASTVAGAENLVAVRWSDQPGSLYSRLLKAGIEAKVSLVNEDGSSRFTSKIAPYQWALDNYLRKGLCSKEFAANYPDQFWISCAGNAAMNHHQLSNHDFFVSQKAFFFDLSPWEDEPATDSPGAAAGEDRMMLRNILHTIWALNKGENFCYVGGFPAWAYKYTNFRSVGGSHSPVATEWEYARVLSAYNAFKDADAISYGAMANASFWQHYPLKDEYPQKWVTRDELRQRGLLDSSGKVVRDRKYMLFYVGDFDAASWIYQKMPSLWEDSSRGEVPMMWCINPNLCRRAPMVMDYLRSTATDADYFAAGDNGAGYLNPGMLEEPRPISGIPSGVDAWAEHNIPYYKQWGLSITGFVIDGFAPAMGEACMKAYARFSPNGIVPQKCELGSLVDGMPVLRSGPDVYGSASDAALSVCNNLDTHPDFPFYWFRAILQSPSWYAGVKRTVESRRSDVVWLDAPSFFELLRIYLNEK